MAVAGRRAALFVARDAIRGVAQFADAIAVGLGRHGRAPQVIAVQVGQDAVHPHRDPLIAGIVVLADGALPPLIVVPNISSRSLTLYPQHAVPVAVAHKAHHLPADGAGDDG